MKKIKISTKNAKHNKLFYVVATTTIYNDNLKKCLILKRAKTEKVHPGKWCVSGGKLEYKDIRPYLKQYGSENIYFGYEMLKKLVIREAKEETNLKVSNITHIGDVVFVRPDLVPVVCIKFASTTKGKVIKYPPEFDDYAWVTPKDLKKYHVIKSVIPEINQTFKLFEK